MTEKKIILVIVVIVLFGALALFFLSSQTAQGKYDQFAACLKEKGAEFYGAFWCPHCQNQKKLFEGADKYLPYIECSTPDGKGQLEVCKEKNISSYPTWIYPDESSESGEVSLSRLAEKTGCSLP